MIFLGLFQFSIETGLVLLKHLLSLLQFSQPVLQFAYASSLLRDLFFLAEQDIFKLPNTIAKVFFAFVSTAHVQTLFMQVVLEFVNALFVLADDACTTLQLSFG